MVLVLLLYFPLKLGTLWNIFVASVFLPVNEEVKQDDF